MQRRTGLMVIAIFLVAAVGPVAVWLLWPDASTPEDRDASESPTAEPHGDQQLYTCGMHPSVVQKGPGRCPICGMKLTPMKAQTGAKRSGKESKDDRTIRVDPVMVQNMGVRVATVRRGHLARSVRTVGEVVVAEDLVSVVNLKYSGWIEKLYVDQTGIKVRAGQPLFRIYSPQLVEAQEEYLLALRTAGADSPLARSAKRKLRLWDLGDRALARLASRGKARRTLTVTAPRSGYVLHKKIVEGTQAKAGQDLFRIGKLSAIWVHAQVYEYDAPWIEVGQHATMELSFQRGKLYKGRVSYIYPTLNQLTRTLTVRLEFVNPQLRLKPGMFTTVRIKTRRTDDTLLVPTEAIIHSGQRQIVFVTAEVGSYEPRQITTGLAGDGHVTQVLSGVKAGDKVVVSGQFLLDSESQLQEALQKLTAARLQAKGSGKGKGKAASPATQPTGRTSKGGGHRNESIWTCAMHPQVVQDKPGTCPICGMDLVEKKRGGQGR